MSATPTIVEPKDTSLSLLHKLIALYACRQQALRLISDNVDSPGHYVAVLRTIEHALRAAGVTTKPPVPPVPPEWRGKNDWAEQFLDLTSSRTVCALLLAEPLLSSMRDVQAGVLIQLADIAPNPDPQLVFSTGDRAFMRILEDVLGELMTAQPASPAAEAALQREHARTIMREDLLKWLTLYEHYCDTDLPERLNTLIDDPDWVTMLAALVPEAADTQASPDIVAKARAWGVGLAQATLYDLVSSKPALMSVSRRLMRSAWETRDRLPELEKALDQAAIAGDESRRREALAIALLAHLEADIHYEPIVGEVQVSRELRVKVANHFIEARKFAKLDAFTTGWSEVALLAMANYAGLVDVEELFLSGLPPKEKPALNSPEASQIYAKIAQDDRMVRLLRLRPYFSEINQGELLSMRPAIGGYATLQRAPTPPTTTAQATPATQAAQTNISPSTTTPITFTPAASEYADVVIRLTRKGGNTPLAGEAADGDVEYIVTLRERWAGASSPTQSSQPTVANLSAATVLEKASTLLNVPRREAQYETLAEALSGMTTRGLERADRALMIAGDYLFQSLLPDAARAQFDKYVAKHPFVRIVVETDAPELIHMPWEWLRVPSQGTLETTGFVAREEQKFSLVRSFPDLAPALTRVPSGHPRVLLVMARPSPMAPTRSEQRVDILRDLLRGTNIAHLETVAPEYTNWDSVDRALQDFRPDILHIEGYEWLAEAIGSLGPEWMTRLQDVSAAVETSALAEQLRATEVPLVVFATNFEPSFLANPLLAAAAALVRAGVPAAIAPTRTVRDNNVSKFAKELYRCLGDGMSLDHAMATNRHRLKEDWSAYALFARPGALDTLRWPMAARPA